MINSKIYPARVVGYIINAVRGDPTQFGNLEIMNPYFFRIALRTKFLARILKVTHKLLLFGVHRNDGLLHRLKFFSVLINKLKLGVTIRMRFTLQRFAV